jgi:hypothetical protein
MQSKGKASCHRDFRLRLMPLGRIRLGCFILAQGRLGLRYTKEEFLSR